jgi:hypothetical protein
MTSIFDNVEELEVIPPRSLENMVQFWKDGDLGVNRIPHMLRILEGYNATKLNGFRQLFWRIDQVTDGEEEFNSVLVKLVKVIEDPKFPEDLDPKHVALINKEISKDLGVRQTAISKSALYNLYECYYNLLKQGL